MNIFTLPYSLLAAYSDGAYGTSLYGDTAASDSGVVEGLANTGYDVLIPIIVAASLIGAGAILLVRRWLRRRKASGQPV